MDKNKCNSCGEPTHKCSCKNKDFTKAVIEIDNPEQITLMRKVVIPASMGDDTVVKPVIGKYRNVLLYYEANQKSYLYSSDGIPTQLVNGVTDYEAATNLPQINGNTLIGDKTGEELGLQDKLTAGDNITIENDVISATDTTYGPATDTEIGLVKPGDGLEVASDGTLSISDIEQYVHFFDTVADMKAADNLVNGSFAGTYGFYTKGDGGSAKYKVREITNNDVVDEMFLIALADENLVAELVIEQELYSKQCGLIGDGTTDETAKLNTFFGKSVNFDKIVNNGIFKTTGTVYIIGQWKQNTGNNNAPKIIFDKATIKYMGDANECSVVVCNMFKNELDNLSIARDSSASYVKVTGCWFDRFINWDIPSLKIQSNNTDMGSVTIGTYSCEYLNFEDCCVSGMLTIDCGASGYFINVLTFNNCEFDGKTTFDYNVELLTAISKQDITFNNCDLSYATKAVFNIPVAQTGRCFVSCTNCYFDSAISLFKDNEQNKAQFNFINNMLAPNSKPEFYSIYTTDLMKNMAIGGQGSHAFFLPTMNVNFATNGNWQSSTLITGNAAAIGSDSTASWTKEWITSGSGFYNRARKVTSLVDTKNLRLNVPAVTRAPWDGEYIFVMRCKILAAAEGCEISCSFGGAYHSIYTEDFIGKEIVFINNKKSASGGFAAGDNLECNIYITKPEGFIMEVYETAILPGKLYIPNAPLHSTAVLS